MSLLDLPEEIVRLILNDLDTRSIAALYETCNHLKHLLSVPGLITQCDFSLSTLAIAKSLTQPFFIDIAGHLKQLNLYGIQDLCKTSLFQAMRKLKVIKDLNVAHTNITLEDLLDIYHVSPSLVSVTINLAFSKTVELHPRILPKDLLTRIQKMFSTFETVHLMCDEDSINIMKNNLILILLKGAHLHNLSCTYVNRQLTKMVPRKQDVDIANVCDILDLRFYDSSRLEILNKIICVRSQMDLENKDYIIIQLGIGPSKLEYRIHCSQSFKPFFHEKFGVNAETDLAQTRNDVSRNNNAINYPYYVVLMIWNKKNTEFSNKMLNAVYKKLELLLPVNYLPITRSNMQMHSKNWIFVTQRDADAECKPKSDKKDVVIPPFKKIRLAPPSITLDCDDICRDTKDIVLSMHLMATSTRCYTLSTSSLFLKEIIHLSLTASASVVYDVRFFNVLLRSCYKLETLNIDLSQTTSSAVTSFAKCLPLSASLKNLRFVDDFINFNTLLSSLSQCKTLENILIEERAQLESVDLPDLKVVFVNCKNLYSFILCAPFYETARLCKLRTLIKDKKTLGLHGLYIALVQTKDFDNFRSIEKHVHLDVFNPVPFCKNML